MAAETNTMTRAEFAKAQAIDYVNHFVSSVQSLQEMLGVSSLMPLTEGSTIKVYTSTLTQAAQPAEGELIPLSKITQTVAKTYELILRKWRTAVTAEAIQRSGFQTAVIDADNVVLRTVQKDVRGQFIALCATGTGTATGTTFQEAIANAWAKLQILFEDYAVDKVIAFVNPMDIATYIGQAAISIQTAFGMSYFEPFLGVRCISSGDVPKGTFYATVPENINIAYPTLANGEIAKAFDFTTDETGLIGINHESLNDSLRFQSVVTTGVTPFPERLDGIVVGTITSA